MPDIDPPLPPPDPGELLARALRTSPGPTGGERWTPPTPEELAALLPPYRIATLLGRGGMGAVDGGVRTALDRPVAIKLLPLEISADQSFADRFVREARTLARLNHPNIVGVCEALAYAHGKGVVHRDIQPANVLVSTEGQVKVADFGLAHLNTPDAPSPGTTVTGTVTGTPAYMAPEQTRGLHVDHRADIYSLGVMLYEMLCGEVPRGAFDPPAHRVQVDGRVDEVVHKAMQSEPERRYQNTGEMKTDVDHIRSTPNDKERRFSTAGENGGVGTTAVKNRRLYVGNCSLRCL